MVLDLTREVAQYRDELIRLRRDIHSHPELAFQEERTSKLVADGLREAGLEVKTGLAPSSLELRGKTGLAKTGVVGLLRGARPGKTLMVRADMDALPIVERRDTEYRSGNEGVMHACGHDGHTAVAVIVAKILAKYRDQLAGNIKFVFQPAEEVAGGAEDMIKGGVLQDPPVDAALAIHLWNYLPVGQVGVRAGPAFASADEIEITIKGKGGHGAHPHETVDPIVVASQVITALQTVVSREVSPFKPAVVTIGTIQGGTAFNIIADEVRMKGTVRCFEEDLRQQMMERIEAIVRGVTSGMRAMYDFKLGFGAPPVVNDEKISELVRRAAVSVVGEHNVVTHDQSTGGDDMACFLQKVPGCYFVIGSANPAKGLEASHHSPDFDFDEEALQTAAKVLAKTISDYLMVE